jgi:hypothetical protein
MLFSTLITSQKLRLVQSSVVIEYFNALHNHSSRDDFPLEEENDSLA